MTLEIFNLNLPGWDIIVLSIIPAGINFAIFLYASVFMPQNETIRSFAIFVFLLGLWQLGESGVKMSQTAVAGLEWNRISTFVILFVISTGISFILNYTNWKRRVPANLYFFLIFFPAVLCSFIMLARLDQYTISPSIQWHWVINPLPSVFTGTINLWIALGGFAMLTLILVHFRLVRESEIKRKRALLLVIGLSVPVVCGIILEIILPVFLKKDNIPITNSLLSVFSISTLIAIRKYKIFEYSPNYLLGRIKDSMSEGVVIVDNNENVVFANKKFCHLVGDRFDRIENRNINEFLFVQEGTTVTNLEGLGEMQLTSRNGTKTWTMVSGSPYLDERENRIGTIILLANINLLKESEESLRHVVSKLEQVANDLIEIQAVAKVGNWELDFASMEAVWSDVALKIYGLPAGENTQTYETWMRMVHPDDLARVTEETERSGSTLSSSSFYHRIICPDGTVKNILSVSKFKFDSEGKPVGLYGLCHDVTELIGLQEKLKASNHELKTFIYRSSHDLRTPLTSIMGLLEVADLEITDPKAREYFAYIDTLSKKMDHLSLTLINVMSVRDHRLKMNDVDLGKLLDEIVRSLKYTEGFDSITFHVEDHIRESIQTDRMLLQGILFNLIENAIMYRNRNLSEPLITIRITEDPKNILIEVIDNGIGIKEEGHDKVFDMFFRATNLSIGSGLGLYMVRSSVEHLGGSILLESREMEGTRFSVSLPK